MWQTVLAVSSFAVVPITFIFLVYATGLMVFTLQWKLFVVALVLFLIAVGAHIVIGIISEG